MFGRIKGRIRFDKKGLIPAIVQDAVSQEVLMIVRMDKKALKKTMDSGDLWLYNRSLKKVWKKGQHSGNTMTVKSIRLHHNKNALLVLVIPHGPACHTGNNTCFYETYWQGEEIADELNKEMAEREESDSNLRTAPEPDEQNTISADESEVESRVTEEFQAKQDDVLSQVYSLIQRRRANPVAGSSRSQLFGLGKEEIAKRLGTEAVTLALSLTQAQSQKIVHKSVDLLYLWLLLLADQGISLADVLRELWRRYQDEEVD